MLETLFVKKKVTTPLRSDILLQFTKFKMKFLLIQACYSNNFIKTIRTVCLQTKLIKKYLFSIAAEFQDGRQNHEKFIFEFHEISIKSHVICGY